MLAAMFAEIVVDCLVGDGRDADGSVAGFVAEFVDGFAEAFLDGGAYADIVLFDEPFGGGGVVGGTSRGAAGSAGRSGMASAGWLTVRVIAGLRVVVMRLLR